MDQKLKNDCNIGRNLKRLRKEHGFSQERLCAQLQLLSCDIGRSSYAKYEAGLSNIRVSVLLKLKDIYNCSYDEFFKEEDEEKKEG